MIRESEEIVVEAPTQESEKRKVRNLRKDEVKKVIRGFLDLIEPIEINNKKLVLHTSLNSITTNPELGIEEIRQVLKVKDKSKLDLFRQLYIRSGNNLLRELFEDDILNMPTVSFEEHGHVITLTH